MKRLFFFVLVLAGLVAGPALAAPATTAIPSSQTEVDEGVDKQIAKDSDELKGKELLIARPLPVKAGNFHVRMQGGEPVSRGLSVWETSCSLQLKESRPARWEISSGAYQITKMKRYTRNCGYNSCDYVTDLSLKTLSGPVVTKLDCSVEVDNSEPGNTPGKMTAKSLAPVLGDYITIK